MENNNQKQVTFEDIENNEEINEYITKGNEYLGVMIIRNTGLPI